MVTSTVAADTAMLHNISATTRISLKSCFDLILLVLRSSGRICKCLNYFVVFDPNFGRSSPLSSSNPFLAKKLTVSRCCFFASFSGTVRKTAGRSVRTVGQYGILELYRTYVASHPRCL